MRITLVTGNKNKVIEFKKALEPEIKVDHVEMSYPEMRSDNPEEIAKHSAKQMAEKLQKAVVVEDSGLFITALKGFPGTCSAYIHKRIGLDGIIKLMKGVKDREAIYKSAVAYCEPNKIAVSFLGTENGTIAEEIKGNKGFGHDPIFIPVESKQTYGEMENPAETKKFRKRAIEQLRRYLMKKPVE